MRVHVSLGSPLSTSRWLALASRWPALASRWPALASRWPAVAKFTPLAVAMGLWASALPGIDTTRMSDLGLISVLPPQVPLAVVLIVASAAWHLRRERLSGPFLAVHLAALILVLYGTPTIIEEEPRFAADLHSRRHFRVHNAHRLGRPRARGALRLARLLHPSFVSEPGDRLQERYGSGRLGARLPQPDVPGAPGADIPFGHPRHPPGLGRAVALRVDQLGRAGLLLPPGAQLLPFPVHRGPCPHLLSNAQTSL